YSRRWLEPCRRCLVGRTTDRTRPRPDTAFRQARTEQGVHRPFGPSNIPRSTSSVSFSSRARGPGVPVTRLLPSCPAEPVRLGESQNDIARRNFDSLQGNQARPFLGKLTAEHPGYIK